MKRKHGLRASTNLSSNGNLSPKIPKLSPEIFKDKLEFEAAEQDELAPRRLTRQSVLDNAKKGADAKQASSESLPHSEENNREEQKADSVRKKETRRSRRYSSSHQSCSTAIVKTEPSDTGAEAQSPKDTEDAPPPLLIPSSISSQKPSDNGSQDSKGSSGASSESCKEDILDRILSWQLLPPEKIQANPTAPSLLYGAHHLLRLFGMSVYEVHVVQHIIASEFIDRNIEPEIKNLCKEQSMVITKHKKKSGTEFQKKYYFS